MPSRWNSAILLLVVSLAGVAIWALYDTEPETADPLPESSSTPTIRSRGNTKQSAPKKAPAKKKTTTSNKNVLPRVLPPDAAIEDIRDALTLPERERAAAVTEATAALGRVEEIYPDLDPAEMLARWNAAPEDLAHWAEGFDKARAAG